MAGSILKIAAPLALSYFAPGIGTALGSTLSKATLGAIGGALGGAGAGAVGGGGLKGAALGALGGGLTGYGLQGGFNDIIGTLPGGALQGPSLTGAPITGTGAGSGALGAIGDATGLSQSSFPSIGGLSGSSGGGSSFNLGSSIASGLGGAADDDALKKAQEQLLAGNQQQLANIDSYEPGAYLDNPEYKFQQAEGEKAINRTLGSSGNLFSGRALTAAADYNKGINTDFQQRDYQQYLNRVGLQNPLYGSNANTQAATSIGRANNLGTTLQGVLNPQQGMTAEQLAKLLRA
jgi:hypothetical protein